MKPILYSTEMVQSILEGRKTQTRRLVWPQPKLQFRPDSGVKIYNRKGNIWEVKDNLSSDGFSNLDSFKCKYSVGDILYVREAFCPGYFDDGKHAYKADWNKTAAEYCNEPKWKPSIHMPKDAARIFQKISNIRIERLNDISERDCVAEGIQPLLASAMQLIQHGQLYLNYLKKPLLLNDGLSPFDSFKSLWEKINGKYSWESNPWVWVYDFERVYL